MALLGDLFGLVLVFSTVYACNFKIVDLSQLSQVLFDFTNTIRARNDVDCFIACGGSVNCTAVAWDEEAKDCHILTRHGTSTNTSTSTLSTHRVIVYAREEFLCGND
ncbi:hypothetical protein CAPTEDRAFT_208765, partial [Capitella teleta]